MRFLCGNYLCMKQYLPVWFLAVIILATGMFFPKLMDTDAPEYAGIAMHMHQTGQWGSIINRTYETGAHFDYLDKPHMLYWSALPGFAIFGETDYGYRLMSVLLTLFAAVATCKVGSMLYNKTVGHMAALMFVTSQAILLANHDVRTDSLLTSFCILCIWQVVVYILKNRWQNLIWAGAFLAGAVATKGMIAVLVCGCAIFFYLLGQRAWKILFNWKWVILVASFFVFLSPVLYFYYVQFDLHPEKLVNGGYGTSGVKFILWTQSFERFAGDRAFEDNPEFSFFFHTLLWAILPWSILCYAGVFNRIKELFTSKGRSFFDREQLTFSGVWVMFILMSFSKFKLPHYLNVLFPLMCVFTAGYLHRLFSEHKERVLKGFSRFQWVLVGLMVALTLVLNIWAFRVQQWWIPVVLAVLIAGSILYYRNLKPGLLERVWVPSALGILLFNFVMNTNFYPQVDEYQGGSSMAARIKEVGYNKENVYTYGMVVRSFDFYMNSWTEMLDNAGIDQKKKEGKEVLLFLNDYWRKKLEEKYQFTILETRPDFHITGLDGHFINPKSRPTSYGNVYLVKIQ
jgi:4-amino-4-deoxy-L-arabinose transferase-like glycosyltransferase